MTTLYIATSINGYIAKPDDNTEWLSAEDNDSFEKKCREYGNVVLGRRSFETLKEDVPFPFFDVTSVVVTRQKIENTWGEKAIFTDAPPQEIVAMLQQVGFENVLIGGGSQINAAFLKAGQIDDIYVDIEPVLFGKGIKLAAEEEFDYKLELLETKKLNANTVQLHYKVLK
jgi:dihydrofolate reductase